jgi:hypothetical protein
VNELKLVKALFDGNKPFGAISEVRLMHSPIRKMEVLRCGLVFRAGKGCGYGQ